MGSSSREEQGPDFQRTRSRLESNFQAELHLARVKGPTRFSKSTSDVHVVVPAPVSARKLEVYLVQSIEDFIAELQAHPLCKLEVLEYRGIPSGEARAYEGVASLIARARLRRSVACEVAGRKTAIG